MDSSSTRSMKDKSHEPLYFTFKDYLTEEEAKEFFNWSHTQQVEKVKEYLDYLGTQATTNQFTASSKASIAYARLQYNNVAESIDVGLLEELIDGKTRSGFGAFGTDPEFLPQKELSLAVAKHIEKIGHIYKVEQSIRKKNKSGIVEKDNVPQLNSRSFYFYWCHAEKQKLMDMYQKLQTKFSIGSNMRCKYWNAIVITVDRVMCADCIEFVTCFARNENSWITIEDPQYIRLFPPSIHDSIQFTIASPDTD